eukprot:gene30418-37630_t
MCETLLGCQRCQYPICPEGGGSLVFTSSVSVYGAAEGQTVNEGGNVIRLAGLYHATRGPHTYYLQSSRYGMQSPYRKGRTDEVFKVDGSGHALVNMLHYDDAAEVVIKALTSGLHGQVFLAVDDSPVSKQDICSSALESGLFGGSNLPESAAKSNKICDSSATRAKLDWRPKHPSFVQFMRGIKESLQSAWSTEQSGVTTPSFTM